MTAMDQKPSDDLRQQLESILAGMSVYIVDMSFSVVSGRHHLVLIVYKADGIGHSDLEKIHRTVQARLEILFVYGRDVHIEISTPGIERKIKHPHEYTLYMGKGIRIMAGEENEWHYGILSSYKNNTVEITTNNDETIAFHIDSIKKAKLDPDQDRG
jgi:ribosome maturation factor RimP